MTDLDMDEATAERLSLQAEDGHRILVEVWAPEQPRCVIHLLHGLGEHAARYERFAAACNNNGIAVIAHNHRGHGENCPSGDLGHYADERGWEKIIDDVDTVQQSVRQQFAGVPITLLGHSMGSYIAQSYVIRRQPDIANMILSASTFAPRIQLQVGHWLAAFECWRLGGREKSALLNKLGFGDFNKRFAPNRSPFDWLSRDEREVDKYVADPLCGQDSSCQLWHDLTGGLLEIGAKRALQKIRADLPILITGGTHDPVGGQAGLTKLNNAYLKSGHSAVTLKLYEEGRHEMFNETNRDEFTRDLIEWISSLP